MLSDLECVLTWWHQDAPSACPRFCPVTQRKHPAPPCPPHCGSRFHSCDTVWAWFILLVQLQWSSPRQHQVHLFYAPYYAFSQFLTLLFILVPHFLCPSLFPNKQPAPIMFSPLVSVLLPPTLSIFDITVTWIILALQCIMVSVIQVLLGLGRFCCPPVICQVWPSHVTAP